MACVPHDTTRKNKQRCSGCQARTALTLLPPPRVACRACNTITVTIRPKNLPMRVHLSEIFCIVVGAAPRTGGFFFAARWQHLKICAPRGALNYALGKEKGPVCLCEHERVRYCSLKRT